ncbi:hypothetical protein PCANC_17859 [Puccinia coronata f. sp. avenae]|uniref:F-box domain-containing protein n=2 Tax=Puccinia coronata f. sp. avenae TaxID=200324 RepID=A0A2N5U714_9BASI|nr:hypothetical protein PCANC_17859 [Puccinia coronata f. sp. avenae]
MPTNNWKPFLTHRAYLDMYVLEPSAISKHLQGLSKTILRLLRLREEGPQKFQGGLPTRDPTMTKFSTFEKLPVEIVELCLEGLPASSIGALLGLSRQTRHLVLTSIEFIFAKMLKSFDEKKQYVGLEAVHTSLSVTDRSTLTFSNFVAVPNVSTVPKIPLRYARFQLETPMNLPANESDTAIFTCSVFAKESDCPGRNFFEDLCKVRDQNPIVVDKDGLLLNTAPAPAKEKDGKQKEGSSKDAPEKNGAEKDGEDKDPKVHLTSIDINPFKVICLETAARLKEDP